MYVDLVIVSEWHLFKQTDGLILNQNSSSLAWYGCTIIAKMWIFLFFPLRIEISDFSYRVLSVEMSLLTKYRIVTCYAEKSWAAHS